MTTNPFQKRRLLEREKETLQDRIRDIDAEIRKLTIEIESEVRAAFRDNPDLPKSFIRSVLEGAAEVAEGKVEPVDWSISDDEQQMIAQEAKEQDGW